MTTYFCLKSCYELPLSSTLREFLAGWNNSIANVLGTKKYTFMVPFDATFRAARDYIISKSDWGVAQILAYQVLEGKWVEATFKPLAPGTQVHESPSIVACHSQRWEIDDFISFEALTRCRSSSIQHAGSPQKKHDNCSLCVGRRMWHHVCEMFFARSQIRTASYGKVVEKVSGRNASPTYFRPPSSPVVASKVTRWNVYSDPTISVHVIDRLLRPPGV